MQEGQGMDPNLQAHIAQQSQDDGKGGFKGLLTLVPKGSNDLLSSGGGGIEQAAGALFQQTVPGALNLGTAGKSVGPFGEKVWFTLKPDGQIAKDDGGMGGGDLGMPPGGDMEAMQSAGQDMYQAGANEFQQVDTRQPEPPQQTPMMDQQPIQQGRGWS